MLIYFILGLTCTLSIIYILINIFKLSIPEVSNYYSKYSYKAYLNDYIRLCIYYLLFTIIFNYLHLTSIVLFIGGIFILSGIINISLFQLLSNINNNSYITDFIEYAGNYSYRLVLQDILVIITALLFNIIFTLIGMPISLLITLIVTGFGLFNLLIIR